jgi:hypothetical protein
MTCPPPPLTEMHVQVYHAANLGRLDRQYRPAGVFVQRGDGSYNHIVCRCAAAHQTMSWLARN